MDAEIILSLRPVKKSLCPESEIFLSNQIISSDFVVLTSPPVENCREDLFHTIVFKIGK